MTRIALLLCAASALALAACGDDITCPLGTYPAGQTCLPATAGPDRTDTGGADGGDDADPADGAADAIDDSTTADAVEDTEARDTEANDTDRPDTSVVDVPRDTASDSATDAARDAAADTRPDVCVPDCLGKDCGPDGCGGSCGVCGGGTICTEFECVPPSSGGACTNSADTAILAASADTIQGALGQCAVGCFGGGDVAGCSADCIEAETGLSSGCSLCFGQTADCTVSACIFDCITPENPACLACVESACGADFEACAGIEIP